MRDKYVYIEAWLIKNALVATDMSVGRIGTEGILRRSQQQPGTKNES